MRFGQRGGYQRAEQDGRPTTPADPTTQPTSPATDATTEAPATDAPATDAPVTDPPASDTLSGTPIGSIDWQPFGDSIETGYLTVPVDYEDPDGETFELYVARHLANDQDDKIGSLLVNPGGPGFPGTTFALAAEQVYGEDLLDRFDIVGWDPRGTGMSEPAIDCIYDYDEYASWDITPDDATESQEVIDLAEEFADRLHRGQRRHHRAHRDQRQRP